jgi:hypothetical protein
VHAAATNEDFAQGRAAKQARTKVIGPTQGERRAPCEASGTGTPRGGVGGSGDDGDDGYDD